MRTKRYVDAFKKQLVTVQVNPLDLRREWPQAQDSEHTEPAEAR